ncbi:MAG: hypothetical protein IPK32_23835 [Verrucomicrobiaceae bacterium]|nr:hypothetical protein [Verrucomicrobiaceae bacterium]
MKFLFLALASMCLLQCAPSKVSPNQPLSDKSNGKVLNERFYEVNGVRKVERRIIVSTTPKLETKVVTEILP